MTERTVDAELESVMTSLDAISERYSPHFLDIRDGVDLRFQLAALRVKLGKLRASMALVQRISKPAALAEEQAELERLIARGLPSTVEEQLARIVLRVIDVVREGGSQ